MWMDDEDARLEEQNSKGLVKKFNSMRQNASSVYFDVDQLEVIIDHYLERAKQITDSLFLTIITF
jgi:hypothetical protein